MINKIKMTTNGLANSSNAPNGYTFVGFSNGEFAEKSESITNIGGGSGNYIKDCGEILDNVGVTGTQSETILWSLKIPAGFHNVGDMMSIGPAVLVWGGYDCMTEHLAPGPIQTWTNNQSENTRLSFEIIDGSSSYNGTFTFSQVSTTGSGSGVVVQIEFDFGDVVTATVLNGGSGYVPNEEITLENKSESSPVIRVNAYSEPNAIVRSYWSYSENGLDNLCEQVSLDYYHGNWRHVFNSATPSNTVSGWFPTYSEIINPTTLKYIQSISNELAFEIGTCSIPDITQDVWITITGQLENSNTTLFLGLIKALKDISPDETYGQGGTNNGYLDPFSSYVPGVL